jgi:hypothetical protein
MGKITVKHYLNTNLKPYLINGANYYSIYALLRANMRNTKVKSVLFNELYNEDDFNEIINPVNIEYKELIEKETSILQNITSLTISELSEFDTHFVTAYFNFIPTIDIFQIDDQIFSNKKTINFYNEDENATGISLENFKLLHLNKNTHKGISLYDYFSENVQLSLTNYLIDNNCKTNIAQTVNDINKVYFYQSFDKFKWFLNGSKKNKVLLSKYDVLFEDFTYILTNLITDKYGV